MGKVFIKCSSCLIQIEKWDYELKNIKQKENYTCKICKVNKSKQISTCPICKNNFITSVKRPSTTCSYACSNKLFRTGPNNGNWKEDSYRTTCFHYHKKECIVCKENLIVEVHHYDGNHDNNNPNNLIPLCPTHHQYMHSGYRDKINTIVEEYKKNFK